jgi:hypothetical protein
MKKSADLCGGASRKMMDKFSSAGDPKFVRERILYDRV